MFFCCAQNEGGGHQVVEEAVAVGHGATKGTPQSREPEKKAQVEPEPPTAVNPIEEAPSPAVEVAPVVEEPAPAAEEAQEPEPAIEEPAPAPKEPEPAAEEKVVVDAATTQPPAAKDTDVTEFEIEVTKTAEGDTLGIDVLSDKTVFVVTSCRSGGMVERWNSANPTKQVKYGAVIYNVNDVTTGLKPMMAEAAKSRTLKLKVRRHNRYKVTVPKKRILGLDLKTDTATVNRLTRPSGNNNAEDMSLNGWNSSCPVGLEIMQGDVLVEVNGKQGTLQDLLQQVKESTGEVSLVFTRA